MTGLETSKYESYFLRKTDEELCRIVINYTLLEYIVYIYSDCFQQLTKTL